MRVSDTDLDIIIASLRVASMAKAKELGTAATVAERNTVEAFANYAGGLSDRLERERPRRPGIPLLNPRGH